MKQTITRERVVELMLEALREIQETAADHADGAPDAGPLAHAMCNIESLAHTARGLAERLWEGSKS